MIYLASPYSHDDRVIRADRYYDARSETARLLALGYQVYSPIVYGHLLETVGKFNQPAEWWQEFDDVILRAARELWVLQLDGWDSSSGVAHEVALARELEIFVWHFAPGEIMGGPPT